MKYQYYDNGELSQGLTFAELKNRVTSDELVKDETGKWQPAEDLAGWDNVEESATPMQEMNIPPVSVESNETEAPELLRKVDVQMDMKPKELTEKDSFNYKKPSGFWKYFSYDDEYISGGQYFGRIVLQYFAIVFFGLGLYLMLVTIFKRSRSLGVGGSAGAVVFLMALSMIWSVAENMGASGSTYNSYYNSEPEINVPFLLFSLISASIGWWLTLANSREIMLGGPKALLRSLKVYSPKHRKELGMLLEREQELRERNGIPEDLSVVPHLIPKNGSEEYQRYFETEFYYLAVRDSTAYYALPEINKVSKPSKLIKKTTDTKKEFEEFKELVSFKL